MSVKGIRFNGETIEIPTEYLQNVSVDGNTITFSKSDGSTMTYTGSSVDIEALMASLDNNYLSFTNNEQTLTEDQQALVRSKIGAGSGSFSGNYEDLANKPTIPSSTSQLTNDSGFITSDDIPETPTNLVTTDTDQTITGTKTFNKIRVSPTGTGSNSLAITNGSQADNVGDILNSVIIGTGSLDRVYNNCVLIGADASGGYDSVAIGSGAKSKSDNTVTIGDGSSAEGYGSSAVGFWAHAKARGSFQLGQGTNNTENTLQFKSYQLLDANGKIPSERLNITTDGLASETYVNTQISNLIDSAPDTLNTLNELAVAIQENDTLIDTLNSAIGTKASQTALDATNQTVSGLSTSVGNLETNKADKTELFSGSYNDLTDKPTSFSGSYSDLSNKPKLNTSNMSPSATGEEDIDGTIYLHKVAKTGNYNDLINKPTNVTINSSSIYFEKYGAIIGSYTTNQDFDSYIDISPPRDILVYGEMDLTDDQKTQARTNIGAGTSNFSGSFNDLTDKPTIPTTYLKSGGHRVVTDKGDGKTWVGIDVTDNAELVGYDGYRRGVYFDSNDFNYELVQPMPNGGYFLTLKNVAKTNVDNNFSTSQTITGNVTATTFNAKSDRRLKENIVDYRCEKSILDLPIKEFDYKNTGTHAIGCIAQDLQEICPEIVNTDKDGYLSIQESKLVYLLLQEVKQLKAEIDKLKEV